jgi:hypothetical protein
MVKRDSNSLKIKSTCKRQDTNVWSASYALRTQKRAAASCPRDAVIESKAN